MNKKKILTLGSITALALPLSFVVACNSSEDDKYKEVKVKFDNGTITVTFNNKNNTTIKNNEVIINEVWDAIKKQKGNNNLKNFTKLIVIFKQSNKTFMLTNTSGFSTIDPIENPDGGNWIEKN